MLANKAKKAIEASKVKISHSPFLALLALLAFLAFLPTGCGRSRTPTLLGPNSGVVSVTLACVMVDASRFPENKVWVGIEDQSATPQTDLAAGNFNLTEQGAPQVVQSVAKVSNAGTPLYAVLVVGQAASMSGTTGDGQTRLTVAKDAAKAFVNAMGTSDQAAVVLYADAATTRQDFTSNKALLIAAIDAASASGANVVYDAIGSAVDLLKSKSGRRVVMVITDAAESGSSTYQTPGAVSDLANTHGLSINTFAITTGTDSADTTSLKAIAEKSGGRYASDADGSLSTACQQAMTRLDNLVEIRFRSTVSVQSRVLKIYLNYGGFSVSRERSYSY